MRRIYYGIIAGLIALGSYGCEHPEDRVSYGDWSCKIQNSERDPKIREKLKARNSNGCVLHFTFSNDGKRKLRMNEECKDFTFGDADLVLEGCRSEADQ